MQVYLQYKYYITVTKIGGQHPILQPGINPLRFGGNIVMRMGTQQQLYNNQDRYVNEFVPPRALTLLSSSHVYHLKHLDTNYFFLDLLSLIIYGRVRKNNY